MTGFKLGEKVKLKPYYLRTLKQEVKRQFSGSLTIMAIEDHRVRLSNGEPVGLCRLSCSVSNIEKVK